MRFVRGLFDGLHWGRAIHRGVAAVVALLAIAMPLAVAADPGFDAADGTVSSDAAVSAGVPVRVRVPSINLDAAVEVVPLQGNGSVGTPQNFANVGWYERGARPGEPGNSVLLGHVDSTKGTAVFWNLQKVQPGDRITVVGDDGIEHSFAVAGLQRYSLDDVPMDKIYGPTDGAHLNLVTCDSDTPFNRRTGEYGGYVVVFADATP